MEFVFIIAAWILGGICAILFMKKRIKKVEKQSEKPDRPKVKKAESPYIDWENSTLNTPSVKHLASLNSCNTWSLSELFENLGVKVKQVYSDTSSLIGYEGGTFFMENELLGDYIHLVFFNICFTNYRYLHKVLMIANELNLKNNTWSCNVKILPDGYDERPVRVSLKCQVKLSEKLEDMERDFRSVLQESFRISRDFHESFKEMKEMEKYDHVTAENADFYNRIAYIERRKELSHGNFTIPEVHDVTKSMSLLRFFRHFDLAEAGKLVCMRLVYDDHIETIQDIDSISSFDVYKFLKEKAETLAIEQMVIDVCYEKQTISTNILRLEGSTDKSLFYILSISQLPLAGTLLGLQAKIKNYQTRIEVRMGDDDADYWEVKYMLDDANDKLNKNQKDKLTDEQRAMLAVTDSSLSFDMYLGKKLYNEKAYHQALEHFMKIFRYYHAHWKNLTSKDKQLYYQICLYIGFIYMEWHFPDKAFYYLTIAKKDASIVSMQEYINSLCEMHDPRSVEEITGYMAIILDRMKQGDEISKGVNDFYAFLSKRMAYSLIELGDLEQAEVFLNQMIRGGIEIDFAREELDYLSSIRSPKNNRWEKEFFNEDGQSKNKNEAPSDTDISSDDDSNTEKNR